MKSSSSSRAPVAYLAPGTPAVTSYVHRLTPIGPDPVPVWEILGHSHPALLVVVTPIGQFTVPCGQGWILAIR